MTKRYTHPKTLAMPLRTIGILCASTTAVITTPGQPITIGGEGDPGSGR